MEILGRSDDAKQFFLIAQACTRYGLLVFGTSQPSLPTLALNITLLGREKRPTSSFFPQHVGSKSFRCKIFHLLPSPQSHTSFSHRLHQILFQLSDIFQTSFQYAVTATYSQIEHGHPGMDDHNHARQALLGNSSPPRFRMALA